MRAQNVFKKGLKLIGNHFEISAVWVKDKNGLTGASKQVLRKFNQLKNHALLLMKTMKPPLLADMPAQARCKFHRKLFP